MRMRDAHPETYKETEGGGMISLGVFHSQELERFNVLLSVLKNSLFSLGQAIKGLVVMSAQLEEMYNGFLIQKVPAIIENVPYPCLKPLNSWMVDFDLRMKFMTSWLKDGPPTSYWVPAFYFPQGFMTASMQVYARKTKIPIDTLNFWTEPSKTTDASAAEMPENGVNVHGFFIQGCGWSLDQCEMVES